LARVELRVHPPLSYRMSPKRVGALVLEQVINQGETLGDLLAKLASGNPETWKDIYDAQTGQMQPTIMTFLNSTVLSPSVTAQTPLSDGDQIAFHVAYGGG